VGGRYSSTPSEPPWLDGEPELEPGSGREIESWIDGERTSGIGWVERRPGGKVRALGVARMPNALCCGRCGCVDIDGNRGGTDQYGGEQAILVKY
jgi:hypothetical protein